MNSPLQVMAADEPIPVEIKFSRRRSVALEIERGRVLLRAPRQTPLPWLEQFVARKSSWIIQHWQQQQQLAERFTLAPHRGFFPYLGRDWPVTRQRVTSASRVEWQEHTGWQLFINTRSRRPAPQLDYQLLSNWLAHRAQDYLVQRSAALAEQAGLVPKAIVVKNYRRMWGRCSDRGEIALNWRLLLAEPEAIDYVIIHELCHLREFNHSPVFWRQVAGLCPDYRHWCSYFKQRSLWLDWRG